MTGERAWTRRGTPVRRGPDPALLIATLALVAIGLAAVSVATVGRITPTAPHVVRQLVALALGSAAAGAVVAVGHRRVALAAPALYVTVVALLAAVLAVGPVINGARSWLVWGGVQFQPSELAKVAVLLMMGAIAHERRGPTLTVRAVVATVGVAALPLLLIVAQPDFGTFLVFVAMILVGLVVAGARVRHLAALGLAGVVAVVLAWQLDVVKDYQIERLTTFLDAGQGDPRGAGWNTAQAQIAVGAGGLSGRDALAGEQTALGYVPEPHTDFVFAVVAERTGFVGAMVLVACYAVVLWRGLRIAAASPDVLGAVVAAGVVGALSVQVFVGVGMTVGLTPVIGLPLPLVSYGGSSLVVSLAMLGLLQSVHRASVQPARRPSRALPGPR